MKKIPFFSLLLAMCFAGCKHENNNEVVINSAPADNIFKEIKVFSILPDGQTDITFEGGTTCRFPADTVDVLNFGSCSEDFLLYTQIFVTPGDVVSFKTVLKENSEYFAYNPHCRFNENFHEVIFKGKNAAHYNYDTEKRKVIPQMDEPYHYLVSFVDLPTYKQEVQAYRDRENEFLKNYIKTHTVSEDFMNYASAEISNKYAFKLYDAVYAYKCSIPDGYLDDAIITQNLLSKYAPSALELKYVYLSPDENIERIYNAILDEVHPKYHSKLLPALIKHFAERGEETYKESLLNVMDRIEETSADSALLACVREYKPYYLLSGTNLPDDILDRTYLRSWQNEKRITLRQLFNNYKNKAVYLDFWASWCAPCRYFIAESAGNKSWFAGKKVEVVYISLDEDEKAWLQAAKEDKITENQYLLLEDSGNSIQDYLKIRGIPRYLLFNKKHEIEALSAPRPVDCDFEYLKKIIEFMRSLYSSDDFKSSDELVPKLPQEVKIENPKNEQAETPTSVLINGVHWATRNVDVPGAFAANPEDAGMLYQWNRKKAWEATDPVINWAWYISKDTIWKKANDPSPEGWRIPTLNEVEKLQDKSKVTSEWTTINGVPGRIFTDKANGSSIFLPAFGYRDSGKKGELQRVGTNGLYWINISSRDVQHPKHTWSCIMQVSKDRADWYNNGYRADGFNIRCVAE